MGDSVKIIQWTNDITNNQIVREVPFVYAHNEDRAIRALEDNQVVCFTMHDDIGFITPYHARAINMAESGETLVFPCGKILRVVAKPD